MKNIFEILKENNIIYAVCVSMVSLKSDKELSELEYHLIISKKDIKKCRDLKIFPVLDEINKVYLYYLNKQEISIFKKLIFEGVLKKILHNKHGRIYNLKGTNFLEHNNNNIN